MIKKQEEKPKPKRRTPVKKTTTPKKPAVKKTTPRKPVIK
jgi:hypothetical protein